MPRRVDITGKVFGRLTAIECVGKNPNGLELWKCKCECGGETTTTKIMLTTGQTKSCGCLRNKKKDLLGKVFGKLTVIEYMGPDEKNNTFLWRCKCECGGETITRTSSLTSGKTKSCGCLRKVKEREDFTGKVFGRLTVIEYAGTRPPSRISRWKCKCECGKEIVTQSTHLKSGATKSCGCLPKALKHGLRDHRLYKTWQSMRNRCNNPNTEAYEDYGGRGIKICAEWDNFETFVKDMDDTYKKGLTLERKDVNGDYSPENCEWADRIQQANNRRNTRYVKVFGEVLTMSQAARKYNIKPHTLRYRLDIAKMLPENAVTLPVGKGKRK